MPSANNNSSESGTAAKRPHELLMDAMNKGQVKKRKKCVLLFFKGCRRCLTCLRGAMADPFTTLKHESRWIPRVMGPFMSVHTIVGVGMTLVDDDDDDDDDTPEL